MPFTAAHPAIILPFVHRNPKYVSASALIIGSIAPDFEYFFKMGIDSRYSHTFWGLLYFDVPVTIFLLLIFHTLVKHHLVMNLPVALQQRFQPLLRVDFIQYFRDNIPVVLISSLTGAASHVMWDGFTHNSGFFVQRIDFLRNTSVAFDNLHLPLFFVLQHLSTAIGLVILMVYIASMKPQSAVVNKPSLIYWILLLGITGIVILVRFSIKSSDYGLGNLIVTTISGFCIGLIILGLRRINVTK